MGVSGSGKTTIGKLLEDKTGYTFLDADDFHPRINVEKMKAGIPLGDADRWPWLEKLNVELKSHLHRGKTVILACSALKKAYREKLEEGIGDNILWVFLKGDVDVLKSRLESRKGHYMPATLLQSQMDALEEPEDALHIAISQSPGEIVSGIMKAMENDEHL